MAVIFTYVVINTIAIMLILLYSLLILEDLCSLEDVDYYEKQLYFLNKVKVYSHGLLTLFFLFHGDWFLVLLNLPVLYWEYHKMFVVSDSVFPAVPVRYKYYSLAYFFGCLQVYIDYFVV